MTSVANPAPSRRHRRPCGRPDYPDRRPRGGRGERTQPGGLGLLLRIVLCLVFGLPLLFMFVCSFKPDLQIFDDLGSINAFLPTGDLTWTTTPASSAGYRSRSS